MSALPQFHLPNPLAKWPWVRTLNPHYAEVKPESDAWTHGFGALDAKSQRSFDLCNFALLSALVYPLNDKAGLRVACDLMVLFFMFDEFTDKVDGEGARTYADMVMDAIRNPQKPRPEGEVKLGEMARQFWAHAIQYASPSTQARFIKTFEEYVYAVIDEASDRTRGEVRGIEDYLKLRRLTAGGHPSFLTVEIGLNIPDHVMTHPALVALRSLAAESLPLTNDTYSYNIEQAAGHGGHNLVTVVMAEKNVDLDGALDWVSQYHGQILSRFQAQKFGLPSWGAEIDNQVGIFVEKLGYWIRGIDSWSFETERYFGLKAREIQEHRVVALLPRAKSSEVTPMMARSD
ncbi:terpenoid synthase [Gloeopeniophorella convolvens]|nr:terpenoid synthase [Gloeopeniophorella convolvens]